MKTYDLVVIGGGISGVLASLNGKNKGLENVLLIEKDGVLGGSINLASFDGSKEYKEALVKEVSLKNVELLLNTLVINIKENGNIICVSPQNGVMEIASKNIILANGGKEKGINTLSTEGDRCAGVISLKTSKKIFNMENMIPGKNIVLFGDSNISLIEKELKERNVNVVAVFGENLSKESNSICKNVFEGYTLKGVYGKDRLSSITISNGENEETINCDTLIYSLGYLSDGLVSFRSNIALNPLTTGPKVDENFETSMKNVYAIGDGIFIHSDIKEIEEEALKCVEAILTK